MACSIESHVVTSGIEYTPNLNEDIECQARKTVSQYVQELEITMSEFFTEERQQESSSPKIDWMRMTEGGRLVALIFYPVCPDK